MGWITMINVDLTSREAREKLKPRHEPYWSNLALNRSIGLKKVGRETSYWLARYKRLDGRYARQT